MIFYSKHTIWLTIFNILLSIVIISINCSPLYIEFLYSHSFVPDAIKIDYDIVDNRYFYYNATAFRPFPGKLLMSIFLRRYEHPNDDWSAPATSAQSILKRRNLDFCKALDILKNLTSDFKSGTSFFQETFLNSCPLTNGFYYIQNGTLSRKLIPIFLNDGRYLIHFELVQVFDEVIKLINFRFIIRVRKEDEEEEEEENEEVENDKSEEEDYESEEEKEMEQEEEEEGEYEDEKDQEEEQDEQLQSDEKAQDIASEEELKESNEKN